MRDSSPACAWISRTRADNVAGRRLYDAARVRATLDTAERVRAAQEELMSHGLSLEVWDAYRPYSATLALWEVVRDSRFAAPPSSGSLHNRGCALDVTLLRRDGARLQMPTAYDVFGRRAGHAWRDLPPRVLRRRFLLRAVLERQGLVALPEEWWHYQQKDLGLPLALDVPIGRLAALPVPVDVWSCYPPLARFLLLADRWAVLAKVG